MRQRRSTRILLALIVTAALLLALREDLAVLALRKGVERLRAGEPQGAQEAFRQALTLGGEGAALRYNLGVTLYRQGQYDAARAQFDAAIAAAGPPLLPAALYNRGNSRMRRAGELAGRDRAAARAHFEAAVADYRRVLALEPGAADARANLELARQRLAALATKQAERAHAARSADRPSGGMGKPPEAGARAAPDPRRQAGRAATGKDEPGGAKSRRDLSRAEVERMLDEARGRERPFGLPHGEERGGHLSKPEKDW